jgi:hypothetical protein
MIITSNKTLRGIMKEFEVQKGIAKAIKYSIVFISIDEGYFQDTYTLQSPHKIT